MEERIAYLFRQYLENKCSEKEFHEFFSYIRESVHNEAIRSLIKKAYESHGKSFSPQTYVNEHGHLIAPALPVHIEKHPEPAKGNIKWLAAASIVIIASAAVSFWIYNKPVKQGHEIVSTPSLTKKTTQRSEYKYLLLPDSTQVWLNAASSLEFAEQFGKDKREVFLSGEAYFDVKHVGKLPFIIHTGKISTTVLGTAFNIKAYTGRKNVIVSVSRGKVKVTYDNREVATLTRGQQVKVSNADNALVEKKEAVSEATAWQQGNLVYEDEAIEDIIADLERIYDAHVQVNKSSILGLKVSTTFRREIGIEQALQVLCKLTDSDLGQQNGTYIIQ